MAAIYTAMRNGIQVAVRASSVTRSGAYKPAQQIASFPPSLNNGKLLTLREVHAVLRGTPRK